MKNKLKKELLKNSKKLNQAPKGYFSRWWDSSKKEFFETLTQCVSLICGSIWYLTIFATALSVSYVAAWLIELAPYASNEMLFMSAIAENLLLVIAFSGLVSTAYKQLLKILKS